MFISTPFLSSSKLSLYITAWFYIPSILTMFNCSLLSRLLANSSQTGVIFWQCSHQGAEHLTSLSRMMRLISSKDSAVAGFSSGTFFIISINLELYTNIFLHHSWQNLCVDYPETSRTEQSCGGHCGTWWWWPHCPRCPWQPSWWGPASCSTPTLGWRTSQSRCFLLAGLFIVVWVDIWNK